MIFDNKKMGGKIFLWKHKRYTLAFSSMKKLILASFLTILVASFGLAYAEDTTAEAPKAGMKDGPCKTDIETYCKDVQPGEGRIRQCMKDNDAKLSTECKAEMQKHHEEMEATKKACAADREKFCKDAQPGKGEDGIRACMKSHQAELSAECNAAQKEMHDKD